MNKVLWLLLGALGLTLIVLIWNDASGQTLSIDNENIASMVYLSTILAALIAGGAAWRGSFSNALRNAAIWIAVIFALASIYQYSDTVQAFMNR